MRQIISALLGAGIFSGSISYHIATGDFSSVVPLTEWFIDRYAFTFLYAAISASIGIVFMTAGRRGSVVDGHLQKHADSVSTFYASAGGSVAGWVLGICVVALIENFIRYWIISALLASMVIFIAVAPLVGMGISRRVVDQFNNRWFRQNWREPYIRSIGAALVVFSIAFLLYDLRT
jgi:Mn2+/Fe2+ NRAMP family transporter